MAHLEQSGRNFVMAMFLPEYAGTAVELAKKTRFTRCEEQILRAFCLYLRRERTTSQNTEPARSAMVLLRRAAFEDKRKHSVKRCAWWSGLIPLFAVETVEEKWLRPFAGIEKALNGFSKPRGFNSILLACSSRAEKPALATSIQKPLRYGARGKRILSGSLRHPRPFALSLVVNPYVWNRRQYARSQLRILANQRPKYPAATRTGGICLFPDEFFAGRVLQNSILLRRHSKSNSRPVRKNADAFGKFPRVANDYPSLKDVEGTALGFRQRGKISAGTNIGDHLLFLTNTFTATKRGLRNRLDGSTINCLLWTCGWGKAITRNELVKKFDIEIFGAKNYFLYDKKQSNKHRQSNLRTAGFNTRTRVPVSILFDYLEDNHRWRSFENYPSVSNRLRKLKKWFPN